MVDRACGIHDGYWDNYQPPKGITLECPKCKRTKEVDRHKSDPPGTARVVYKCPECEPAGAGWDDIHYFDSAGKEIDLDAPQ